MFSIKTKVNTPKRNLTPGEVGIFVEKLESQLHSPMEKKTKAFAFARMYFDAKEYKTAKKYLEDFLTIQDRDYRVHNLLGETEEALHEYSKALQSYKRSLELCSTQKEVLIKVVSLCCKTPLEPLRAKVWADKASKMCPGHPSIFELKWHLLAHENDFEEMELLLADELTRRPRESSLHIKLVDLYMQSQSFKCAFLHCQSVEKTGAFNDDLTWLQTACNVFEQYREDENHELSSCLCHMATLCKLMSQHLKVSSSRACVETLKRGEEGVKFYSMDIALTDLHNINTTNMLSGTDWRDCQTECKGQLYLFVAAYLQKLAKEGVLSWMQANRMSYVSLATSWLVDAPYLTAKLFPRQSPVRKKNQASYEWSVLACSRLSETGHLLLSFESQFGDEWMSNCVADFCNIQGQRSIFEAIYGKRFHAEKSFLVADESFFQVEVRIPDPSELVPYNEVMVGEHASNLHLVVWLGLHWDLLKENTRVGALIERLFEGVPHEAKNMKNCHFTSLCLRDMEMFIYALIRSCKSLYLECRKGFDEMKLLPVAICSDLVTSSQSEFWQAAYGLYTGKVGNENTAKLKVVVQKGLETIRCFKDHSVDPRILFSIATLFLEKALAVEALKEKEFDYQKSWKSLHQRAVYYMTEAVQILEIYKRNKTVTLVDKPLILPLSEPLLPDDVASLLNKSYMKLAECFTLTNEYETALKYYSEVKSLQSTYSQVQIYMKLAFCSDTTTIEGEKDHLYYITKAKEKLSVCIANADHSTEFKQSLVDQLAELESSRKVPTATRKCLDFEGVDDVQLNVSFLGSTNDDDDVSSLLERSHLQQQLDAKEYENQNLKQTLAMYKAQMDMQFQQAFVHNYSSPAMMQPAITPMSEPRPKMIVNPQQPIIMQPLPNIMIPHRLAHLPPPPMPPHPMPHLVDNYNVTGMVQPPFHPPQVYMPPPRLAPHIRTNSDSTPLTPTATHNGVDSQASDMWWDSFSPQPSFEKGYFSGLSRHVELLREESGEGEAPTLKDSTPATSVAKVPTTTTVSEIDDIYVEPIVKLTSKECIITGEEDEEEKFVHRAKLFRFDKENNQWKERGVGEIKILWNDTTKKARMTMRRDHVLRVCCNHNITSDMRLEQKTGAKSAFTWFTPADASEETVRAEQFTVKFREQEIADRFKATFEKWQKTSASESPKVENASKAQTRPFSNASLVSKAATWDCDTCWASNPLEADACLAYKIPKPSVSSHQTSVQSQATSVVKSTPSMFSFKLDEGQVKLSPEGKPVFAFANEPQKVNPFLATVDAGEARPNPFAGIAFKLNTASAVATTSKSPFSGFSFSTTTVQNTPEKSAQSFPIMSSLLNTTSPSSDSTTPVKTSTITGMEKLPAFEKGVVNSAVDPSTFWTSASPEKSFFTGNAVSLDTIGHKEELRELGEDEFFDNKENNEGDYYYGQDDEQTNYYCDDYYDENDEFYDDVNYDCEGYVDYDPYDDYQPSHASSSRRGSDDDDEADDEEGKQVEDRFEIQRKEREEIGPEQIIDNNLVLTFERKPSFAQKIKASRLQLPPTFYLHEGKPPCSGCRGCVEDFKEEALQGSLENKPEIGDYVTNLFAAFADAPTFAENNRGGVFTGAGEKLFKDAEEGDEEYDPHYEAVVQVSKLQNVKTGEEDDEVLFKQRGKLYRYDEQWKERGVGDMKITRNKNTNYCRVIMRREQIHKLCANHAIMPNMELKLLSSSDRAWVWFTPSDYAEGKPPVPSKFCLKFRNKDISDMFKQKFDECREMMVHTLAGMEERGPDKNALLQNEKAEEVNNEEKVNNIASKFAMEKGQWECTLCLIRNEAKDDKCVSCQSPKPMISTENKPEFKVNTTPGADVKFPDNSSNVATPLSSFKFGATFATQPTDVKSLFRNDIATLIPMNSLASPTDRVEQEHDIHVEAIVQVSKLDKLTTGEENDEVIYSNRVKMFRFDNANKSWKERGVGELKLTRDKTSNACRVIMRREHIHKLCANHVITKETELKEHKSNKALTWFAQADISDGEAKPEQFCVRFKTPELAFEFKESFEKCKNLLSNKTESVTTEVKPVIAAKTDLKAKFAPKEDTWNCGVCLIWNKTENTKCVACETPNPNVSAKKKDGVCSFNAKPLNEDVKPTFKFGLPQTVASSSQPVFGEATNYWTGLQCGVSSCKDTHTTSTFNGFTFKSPQTTGGLAEFNHDLCSAPSTSGFVFGLNKASLSATNTSLAFTTVSTSNTGIETPRFGFQPQNDFKLEAQETPVKTKLSTDIIPFAEEDSPYRSMSGSSAAASPTNRVEQEHDIHVEAIVQVSKLDKLTTGEENDEVIYSNRVKMFRFDNANKSWKERGVGELKLTRDKTSNACRVIMRREHIHKLCANHVITKETELKEHKSNKALTWFAQADISDGEAKSEQFCVRFKTPELAFEFKESFEKCKNFLSNKTESVTTEVKPAIAAKTDLKAKFAPKEDTWNCGVCLIWNKIENTKCVACETPNPNVSAEKKDGVCSFNVKPLNEDVKPTFKFGLPQTPASSSQPVFGGPTNLKAKLAPKENSWNCGICLTWNESEYCVTCKTPKSCCESFTSCSFGKTPLGTSAGYTFGSQLATSTSFAAGYTFGNQLAAPTPFSSSNKQPLSNSFAPDPETWECPACLAKNNGSREVCRQCNGLKAKTPVVKLDPSEFSTPINFNTKCDEKKQFVFGLNAPTSQPSVPNSNFQPTKGNYWNQHRTDKVLMPPPEALPPKKPEKAWVPQGLNCDRLFSFGVTPSPTLSAASSLDDVRVEPTSSAVKSLFNDKPFAFSFEAPKTPEKSLDNQPSDITSPKTPAEECDAEFLPLVSLAHVQHFNGEEDEEVMFMHRSKMFRFDGQWKERGVGELKIMRQVMSKQCRLILRRDQTFKLCANHVLNEGMSIKPMSGASKNAFAWKTTCDISDGQPKEQLFAARFKSELVAREFLETFQLACQPSDHVQNKKDLLNEEVKRVEVVVISDDDDDEEEEEGMIDDDLEVTYVSSVDELLKQQSRKLLLPPTYYHTPSVTLMSAAQRNDETNSSQPTETNSPSVPDLLLTDVRVNDAPSNNHLLPNTFFNYRSSSRLSSENIVVDADVEEVKPKEDIPEVFTSLASVEEIFSCHGYLFRYSNVNDEFQETNEGALKIVTSRAVRYICVIDKPTDAVCYSRPIDEQLLCKMAADSKTVIHLDGGKYALKFDNMPDTERFLSKLTGHMTVGKRVFGSSSAGSSFAALASQDRSGFENNEGKAFAGVGSTLFQQQREEEEVENGEGIYVEPIVQLSTVVLGSGEEDEITVFNERCKLYRFVEKKWKERGVGELKLLRHKDGGRSRLVMRRDQVRKLCANHLLKPTMHLEPFNTNELTVMWNVQGDVSDGPPMDCIFAVRFKNAKLLDSFKELFGALCNGEDVEVKSTADGEHCMKDGERELGTCDPNIKF